MTATQLPAGFRFAAEGVAVGASAGGIDALFALLGHLKPPLPAPIVVVLHLPDDHESHLVQVFSARLSVPVREAQSHAPMAAGSVYFAPPGYHLLVEEDRTFSLSCDAPVLYSRPSIDVLLESCADAFGPGLLGMVLTGASGDGARGLARIHAAGGLTAVQDPLEALHPAMPQAAIAASEPDFVLPLTGLAALLHTALSR